MSRQIKILVIPIAVFLALSIMVYSRQARKTARQNETATAAPVEAKPNTAEAMPNNVAKLVKSETVQDKEKPQCTLNTSQAPGIGGLKLGMTVEQVLGLFPGATKDQEIRTQLARPPGKFGNASFRIIPANYESRSRFQGITQITLNLLDGRVSKFTANYNGPKFSHVDEFVTKFSEELNLPPVEAWEAYVGLDTQLKSLKCDGFEVGVFAGGDNGNLNYVAMKDIRAEAVLRERRAKAEKSSQEAKP